MNIQIKGHYKFHTQDKVIMENDNLITLLGESFFMNRWINNEFEPITYILLGKGTGRPRKTDTILGKQTISKGCKTSVDLKNKQLILTTDFKASEILNTTEIGVTNGEILISHDIYEKITESLLQEDNTSIIHLTYTFNLTTGGYSGEWKTSTENPNIYYIYEPANVVGVITANTNDGYTRKNSINELTPGCYYYNITSKNLYIYPANNVKPGNEEIIVQTK